MLTHFIISAVFLFSLFQGILATSLSSDVDVLRRSLDAKTLLPLIKRTSGLESRDILRRALDPRKEVVLSYGEDFHPSQQQVFLLDVTMNCHDSAPVVLLEEFEDLVSSIDCSTNSITITFSDSFDFDYTRSAWSSLEKFVLISNHPESSCNPTDERGTYMVGETRWDTSKLAVELSVEPMPLLSAAESISVDFGHTTRENFHTTDLTRRQTTPEDIAEDNEDDTANIHPNGTISLDTNFPSRAVLWPLSSNVEVDGGISGESPVDVQITCVDCSVEGELTYRGHFDQDFTDENGINVNLQWAWIEVEVTRAIKSQLKFEFYLSLDAKQWEISLLPVPIAFSPFQIPGVISIGPEFDYKLITALSLGNAEFNFTYGVNVDIPLDSIARFDFKHVNESFSSGWNKTEVNQIPFFINSLDGDLALSVNVTTQPSVGIKVTMLAGDVSAGPTIDFAAPRLLIAADEVHNVTANCSELGPDDYVYYEDAFKFSTAWELGVAISVGAEVDLPLLPEIGSSFSKDLYTHSFAPDITCKVLSNGTKTGELKLASSVDPQVDIPKVQSAVDRTGSLPTGINPDLLATLPASALPTVVKKAVDDAEAGAGSAQVMGGAGILSLLVGVGIIAAML